jgi:hypothetical protein
MEKYHMASQHCKRYAIHISDFKVLRSSPGHYHLHFLESAPDGVLDIIIKAQLTAQNFMPAYGRPT